jgi:uncharacterized protein with NRDE domain
MCLIALSWQQHETYPLALWANRDEFFNRPTAPLHPWEDSPVVAGRDLKEGGTWLGVTASGRWAAITNYRDPVNIRADVLSRGRLVQAYLESDRQPDDFLNEIAAQSANYNGFNLLAGTRDDLYYFSNYEQVIRKLSPGIYGLSNHLLDSPWPKVARIREKFSQWMTDPSDTAAALEALSENIPAPDEQLPDTGMGIEMERLLSPICIQSAVYGTRSSTILLANLDGEVSLQEKDRLTGLLKTATLQWR